MEYKRVLRLPAVMDRTGRKRTSIYNDIKKGDFPSGFLLGRRARGWLESDIENWVATQASKREFRA